MSASAETKVCPLCAETIKSAAKICPCCRSKQKRHIVFWQELEMGGVVLALVVVVVVVLANIAPREKGVGGRNFASHRDELVVLNTSLDYAGAKADPWLVGVVTNRGQHPWRVHRLEVRFQDEQRGLLDVRHPGLKEFFVVLPRQEHAFRAWLGEVVFTNPAVRHVVRVEVATDGDRPLKPDQTP